MLTNASATAKIAAIPNIILVISLYSFVIVAKIVASADPIIPKTIMSAAHIPENFCKGKLIIQISLSLLILAILFIG